MTGFLLDTNVPSELTRPKSDPQVEKWLDDADDEQLFFSVVSLGEIFKGLTILPESKRRQQLQHWLDDTLRPWFEGRILPVSEPIAERWGILAGECQRRWVQRYAPELGRRGRRELKRTGTSWRVDETYVRVAGRWMYLYRALDSGGATLDFYLSEKRDATAAQQFLCKILAASNHPRPRVINVDGNPSYPHAVSRLQQAGRLGRHCRCRTSPYLNNIIEQDHRALKRRINAKQGFRSTAGARQTIAGYEVMHMIRKGQVRWLLRGDVGAQVLFINLTFGLKSV